MTNPVTTYRLRMIAWHLKMLQVSGQLPDRNPAAEELRDLIWHHKRDWYGVREIESCLESLGVDSVEA